MVKFKEEIWLEIDEGKLFVCASKVAAIKAVDDSSCSVFLDGQDATSGGFLVNRPALEIATDIVHELREESESEEIDEQQEEQPPES